MFHGSMVALVTPFALSGEVDVDCLQRLVQFHIENKTDAIVVVGTTGESPTLTKQEKSLIIQVTVEAAAGRIPIIAGTGTNNTEESIMLTKEAMRLGADACLLVTPYYNKPTQEGLFLHYEKIARAVPIPQILYNVPGRTGCDLLPTTVAKLANIANIIGIKEATGNLSRLNELLERCGNKIDLYSGDDATAREFITKGGKGVISVTANICPRLMHDMCQAALAGDLEKALLLDTKLSALHQDLFIESNPIPIKWIMAKQGLISPEIRLPLTSLSLQNQPAVQAAYEKSLS